MRRSKRCLLFLSFVIFISCNHKNDKEYGFACMSFTYSLPDYLKNEKISYPNNKINDINDFCKSDDASIISLSKHHFNHNYYGSETITDERLSGIGDISLSIEVTKSAFVKNTIDNSRRRFERRLDKKPNETEVNFLNKMETMIHGESKTSKGIIYNMFIGGKLDDEYDICVIYSMYCDTCSLNYHKSSFMDILSTFKY